MIASQAADALALPAFVIAIVAAVIALVSLAWNVTEWVWSGPRVRVRTHLHMPDPDRLVLAAYVWNQGRAPIDIVAAEVHRDGMSSLATIPLLGVENPGLPHRLEPGSSVVMETELLRTGAWFDGQWYQSVVTLANGDIRKSKRERSPAA